MVGGRPTTGAARRARMVELSTRESLPTVASWHAHVVEALGHWLDMRIARDAWSTWYRARSSSTPYRDGPSKVVIRVFDEPRDDFHRLMLDETRVAVAFQHRSLWGPVEWPRDELACRVTGVEGWRLIDVVRGGGLPASNAVQIGRDLCSANLYLESHDLGPCAWVPDGERIVVGHDGVVRIEEPMGARLPPSMAPAAQLPPPARRFVLMSPERIMGAPLTTVSAVREIGAALHAVLTGELALLRRSTRETLHAVLSEPLPSLAHRAELDFGLGALVDRACAIEAADRVESLTELAAALDELATRVGPATQPPYARLEAPARLVPFGSRP